MKEIRRGCGRTRRSVLGSALACATLAGASAGRAAEIVAHATSTMPADEFLRLVDPDLRATALEMLKAPRPSLAPASLATRREEALARVRPPSANPAVRQVTIPGPQGAPNVSAYLIGAVASGAPKPVILYVHGGGYISGAAAEAVPELQLIAEALDCLALTVEYRLAPETPFPGAREDLYAAFTWLHRTAGEIGVDRNRVVIMGESAGGGLAASLTFAARDRAEFPVAFQMLIYPMLDDRTASSRSMAPQFGRVAWTPADNRFGWTALLGRPAGAANVPSGSVPSRATSFAGLPPTFIGVGALDLFFEEDVEFARRLSNDMTPVELLVVPGAFHGFYKSAPEAAVSKQFKAAYRDALRRALQRH